MDISIDLLKKWWNNKSINPLTNKKIKQGGRIWNKYLKLSLLNNVMLDSYNDYHNNYIDPLIKIDLPKSKYLFKYKYCWNPLNGQILGKDYRGPLYFDPDVLIHYFYTNRLNHLWIEPSNGYLGTFGDGMGNGPDFFIQSRGHSPHWYLFRLPLFDAYKNPKEMNQQITLGPILSKEEIKEIYILALNRKNNYRKLFGKKRPDLLKLYEIYNDAIRQPDVDKNHPSYKLLKEQYLYFNIQAVKKLRFLV